ncbi:hypothetical protein ABEB36_003870 [Hypothenemus hampei]|uniref:Uncharacterized protein n=1 Tax=Hypothenemus hampei TaxID=57062 RepID=A0ABD1F1D8_HYPHA
MEFLLEQKPFIIENYFGNGEKVDSVRVYSLDQCLQEFSEKYPDKEKRQAFPKGDCNNCEVCQKPFTKDINGKIIQSVGITLIKTAIKLFLIRDFIQALD